MNVTMKYRKYFRLALGLAMLGLSLAFPGPEGCLGALIVATAVINNPNYKSWTLTALDADVALNINHGFVDENGDAVAPDLAIIQALVSYANAALPNWGIVITSTQIQLAKTNAAASGGATPGTTVIAKLYAMRPHSILQ